MLDFDVHHGNGSENINGQDERVLFCLTIQHPFYPDEPFANNSYMICSPLGVGSSGTEFRQAVQDKWLPALDNFYPQIICIATGFDAHKDDYLAALNFTKSDGQWGSEQIVGVADKDSEGRIVSSLEGVYQVDALAKSVEAHRSVIAR